MFHHLNRNYTILLFIAIYPFIFLRKSQKITSLHFFDSSVVVDFPFRKSSAPSPIEAPSQRRVKRMVQMANGNETGF